MKVKANGEQKIERAGGGARRGPVCMDRATTPADTGRGLSRRLCASSGADVGEAVSEMVPPPGVSTICGACCGFGFLQLRQRRNHAEDRSEISLLSALVQGQRRTAASRAANGPRDICRTRPALFTPGRGCGLGPHGSKGTGEETGRACVQQSWGRFGSTEIIITTIRNQESINQESGSSNQPINPINPIKVGIGQRCAEFRAKSSEFRLLPGEGQSQPNLRPQGARAKIPVLGRRVSGRPLASDAGSIPLAVRGDLDCGVGETFFSSSVSHHSVTATWLCFRIRFRSRINGCALRVFPVTVNAVLQGFFWGRSTVDLERGEA